jgi:hypothetical protein
MALKTPGDDRPRSMGFWGRLQLRAATFLALYSTLKNGPFWWLTPFLAILLVLAVLLILVEALPGVAPFVYALF